MKKSKMFGAGYLVKLLALVLAVCMLATLAGCSRDKAAQGQKDDSTQESAWDDEGEDIQSRDDDWFWDDEDDRDGDDTSFLSQGQPVNPDAPRYYVGDSVQDFDLNLTYIASGEYTDYSEFYAPDKGNKYIYLKFAVENTASQGHMSISSMAFSAYADGKCLDWVMVGDDDLSGSIFAGRYMLGSVYFEVPEDTKQVEVEYTTDAFLGESVIFVYEGEKDMGYQVKKDTEPTPGAIGAGETVSSDGWELSLEKSYWENTEEGYYNLRHGYRVVTCELEVKNTTDQEQYVSAYNFYCFADGWICKASYMRSDALGATAAQGETACGTVSFMVPEDARVIEVVYCPFDATSQPMVLDAKPE